MSDASRRRYADPEKRAKHAESMRQPATRAKLSAAHRGYHPSPETRAKISIASRGRCHSPEAREKIARAKRGGISFEERFWARVDSSGGLWGCWPWMGARERNGYGQLGNRILRKHLKAHRVAYELAVGPIPEGFLVCHACDNPPCCNPSHLFVGTGADNTHDMIAKGRGRNQFSKKEVAA
jgi:hypothetical protein